MNILRCISIPLNLAVAASIACVSPVMANEAPIVTLQSTEVNLFESPATVESSPPEQPEAIAATTLSSPLPWQDFTSELGGFSVLMPSPPVSFTYPSEQIPLDPDSPNVQAGQMFLQMRLDERGQMVMYIVGFMELIDSVNADVATDELLSSCAPFNRGNIIRQQPITLSNYSGREIEAELADGSLSVSRCYLAGKRGYFTWVFASPFSLSGEPINASVTRSQSVDVFLNSFRILN